MRTSGYVISPHYAFGAIWDPPTAVFCGKTTCSWAKWPKRIRCQRAIPWGVKALHSLTAIHAIVRSRFFAIDAEWGGRRRFRRDARWQGRDSVFLFHLQWRNKTKRLIRVSAITASFLNNSYWWLEPPRRWVAVQPSPPVTHDKASTEVKIFCDLKGSLRKSQVFSLFEF